VNIIKDCIELELIYIIVKFGVASKIIKCAKEHGVTGGTVLLGKGTIRNSILEFLELHEVRREIVMMAAEKNTAYKALEELNREFRFVKPNHGIAFSISVRDIFGCNILTCKDIKDSKGVGNLVYQAIFIIVDRGKGELVMEASKKAGSKGGTIINARGSGIHECSKLFAMEIEPEKEIVLIISEISFTEAIVEAVREKLDIDKPGNGIIFVQDVNKTYGLY
jgi:nitrogen regulatory protein PII